MLLWEIDGNRKWLSGRGRYRNKDKKEYSHGWAYLVTFCAWAFGFSVTLVILWMIAQLEIELLISG